MSVNSERIRTQIFRIRELPALPLVVTRVLKLVSEPNASVQDLNKIISSDVALASKILRLANSAYYGLSRQVSTITEAVVYLGFNMVKAMALSISVFDVLKGRGSCYKYFSREALWRHAIACGVASRIIARKIKLVDLETVFLAGLLHDIGKLVIDQYRNKEFKQILNLAEREHMLIMEAEQRIIGVDHTEVGYWLADWWKLPESLTSPILGHHNSDIYLKNNIAAIVHVANAICRELGLGNSGDEQSFKPDPKALAFLGLSANLASEIEESLRHELENAEIFLSFARQEQEASE